MYRPQKMRQILVYTNISMKIFRGNSLEIKSHNFHITNIHMIFLIHMINPIHLMVNSISIHSLYLIHYKVTKSLVPKNEAFIITI